MTEEAKKNLLDYMLGKMPSESGVDEILAPNIEEISNSIDTFARQNYPELSERWNPEQLFTRGDYIILWCSDYDTSDISSPNYMKWKKTFIMVLDKKYTPIKFIDKFENGTPLNPLAQINQNDNGTGSIYGVDIVFKSNLVDIDRYRVVIINDFTLTNFNIRLLNSYNIPQYNNHLLTISELIKSPTEAKYFMIYNYKDDSSTIYDVVYKGGALEFVNNVGSDNEWNFYPYTGSKDITWNGFEMGFPTWGENGLEFKIFTDYEVNEYNGNTVSIVILKSFVDGENKSCIDDTSTNLPSECKNVGQLVQCCSNFSNVLVSTTTNSSELTTTVYVIEYNLSDLSYKIWYSKDDYINDTITDGYILSYDDITPFVINNQFYFLRLYRYYKAIHDADWNYTYEYYDNELYLDQIYNDKLTEFFIKDFEQQSNVNFDLLISNVFNLYNFGLIFQNMILNLTQIYNPSNYNGASFTDINSLNSNSAILYSDNNPVFARNLYNKTQNGATTTSTIEIPNNYLNDTLVDQKDLMSINNNVIISDTNGFTKNVYETVYLNFVNTISVVNQNEVQSVYNNAVATKLNTSIKNPTDYDNLKLTKYRINYQDGTNYVSTLQATLQDDGSYELLMTFYLSGLADTLELISEDEETVYLTYNLANAEINKYYSFKQRVRIGGNQMKNMKFMRGGGQNDSLTLGGKV